MTQGIAIALLLLSLAAVIWVHRDDVRNFTTFAALEDSRERQRIFLRWAAKGCAFYLGIPLAGLALIGRLDALWHFPPEFDPLVAQFPAWDGGAMVAPFLSGAGIGLAIVAVALLARTLLRRGKATPAAPAKPVKIAAMYPRNGAETLRILPLILNAGVSEEVFCRLYFPLLMTLAGIDPLVAMIATTLIFGAMHLYQGVLGVVLTAVMGGVLAFLYLVGHGLWLPILFHLMSNLNALIVRPSIKRLASRRRD